MISELPECIVLASQSPRRLALAKEAGWKVTVVPPPESAEANADSRGINESLGEYVCRLAQVKAESVRAHGCTGTILACDTLSEVDGQALGKAANETEAREILLTLSGRIHRVQTGVCIWRTPESDSPLLGNAESILSMGTLTDDFLDWYLASGMWKGKAGACGFQDDRLPLRLLSGSSSNVVGLPIELIETMLLKTQRPVRRS